MKKEEHLQLQICEYINSQHPTALFNTDLAGMKMTMGQAKKVKKLRKTNGMPDLQILKSNSKFNGLFLELKSVTPFKKNGELKKDDHIKEQSEVLTLLSMQGYKAVFVWDFNDAKLIIDNYMAIPSHNVIISTNRVTTFYPNK